MRHIVTVSTALIFLSANLSAFGDSDQQFAEFGTCTLSSGEKIENCRLGYRVYGDRDANDSNIILFPTWFTGTAANLAQFGLIGPGLFADTEEYFVIAVDAFSNGVSSSPSNSMTQPEDAFPAVSIADMVAYQYRLLTEELDIHHVHAIVGVSMGGMQTFEWLVRHPEFMDKAIPVSGTPVQTSYDLLLWDTELRTITTLGNTDVAKGIITRIGQLTLQPPETLNSSVSPSEYPDYIAQSISDSMAGNLWDFVPQLRAMMGQDIGKSVGGTLADAAQIVRAKVLVVISPTDQVVNPGPSREFARLLDARLFELAGECGHIAVACDLEALTPIVHEFLRQ